MSKRLRLDLDEMCPDAGSYGCRNRCTERLECDDCGRSVCFYVKIEIYENGEEIDEIRCRPCMNMCSAHDLETGAFDMGTLERIEFDAEK